MIYDLSLDLEVNEDLYEEELELLEEISLDELSEEELIATFIELGEDDLDYLLLD